MISGRQRNLLAYCLPDVGNDATQIASRDVRLYDNLPLNIFSGNSVWSSIYGYPRKL
jgi:hypothetical protein